MVHAAKEDKQQSKRERDSLMKAKWEEVRHEVWFGLGSGQSITEGVS
jgi:hypothetical protein